MRRFITLATMSALLIVALIISIAGRESLTAHARVLQGDGVRRVTTDELRAAMERGTVVVVDVRGDEAFKTGHIKGAISIPVDQIASRTKGLPRDKMIVAYCS